ncbi:rhodanese-like domain-containing protein [Neptunomonas concharum]|jgi:rhodanese-related sulfurtransferase|uniref:Rhodanese-like domain-containing protein n=1 Tax=Neptunomonas concharum TaxID=1031538 RepID=A0A5P1RF51_9GAMM|nr:rhodanese-like domain-containing protein [Neptunomonas concharum]QEQ97896.1 rhodanese-like domain-containing protein [Neptunomonas concharum]
MEQLIEFASNHFMLVAAWVLTLILIIWSEGQRAGKSVSPAIATQLINKQDAVLIDIRTKKEWDTGYITGSRHIPVADLSRRITEIEKFKSRPVIVVCNLGQVAGSASKQLKAAGFENVMRLQGGITEWKGQNLPIVKKA